MIQYRVQLPDLMKEKGLPLIAIELGVAEGYNSNDLLSNGIEKLYSIDLWNTIEGQTGDGGFGREWHSKNFEAAKERLKRHGDKSVLIRGLTTEVAWMIEDNSCGLIYHDADHSYEGVKRDTAMYWPKLVSGGIFAYHDFEMQAYGVKRAVKEFAALQNLEIHLLPENKKEDAGAYIVKP